MKMLKTWKPEENYAKLALQKTVDSRRVCTNDTVI